MNKIHETTQFALIGIVFVWIVFVCAVMKKVTDDPIFEKDFIYLEVESFSSLEQRTYKLEGNN